MPKNNQEDRTDRMDRPDRSDRTDKAGQADQLDKIKQVNKAEQADQADQADKTWYRRTFRQARNALSPAERKERSDRICEIIRSSRAFAQAKVLFAYHPLGSEVDVRPAVRAAWEEGKTVCFPRVDRSQTDGTRGNDMRMDFYKVGSFADLRPGSFGILEPNPQEAAVVRIAAPAAARIAAPALMRIAIPAAGRISAPDHAPVSEDASAGGSDRQENGSGVSAIAAGDVLVLVPGLVFDGTGGRLGYGKGYYDRYFAALPDCPLMGVAYDFQVVPRLPLQAYDLRMHLLVTDTGCRSIHRR